MPKFVTRRDADPVPTSPELLFRLLKPKPGAGVTFLWSHQADILRDYKEKAETTADVALELPTGAGKTLVGLLLAEYRRRALGQRVAYVCPNRLLAEQVGDKAADYGIKAHVFVRAQRDWDAGDFTEYARAQAIAITSYASIFNTNPRLSDAQTLILDDAHAAESSVASLWSVEASRGEPLYSALRDLLAPVLPAAIAERLADEGAHPWDRSSVEILGPHELAPRADLVREALNVHAEGNAAYSMTMIDENIEQCVAYISWQQILIRPFIAPTRVHHPFADARQRVYMSATLGEGGELERAFGVSGIARLPVPKGWDEHGSGRRFFMFPNASMEPDDADDFVAAAIFRAGRAVVLTPTTTEAERFAERCVPAGTKVLRAAEVERDQALFTGEPRAVLLAPNRYDGMDFANDACRLVVLSGLPSGTHLQERFLMDKLNAERVLSERLRTRILQGSGRCTRNALDYAAVVIRGEPLTDFLARADSVKPMQPEIQAEIEVGFRNSDSNEADPLEYLDSFLNQDPDWAEADEFIRNLTDETSRTPAANSDELANAARAEVEAWCAAWRGEMEEAVGRAREAADLLEGGASLRPYRAFWLFLAASWATSVAADATSRARAEALAKDAVEAARALMWRPRLGSPAMPPRRAVEASSQGRRAAALLGTLGLRGRRFEDRCSALVAGLREGDPPLFERRLCELGELLGFDALHPDGQAQPDGVWRDDDRAWLLFEAKTDVSPVNAISVADVRQAGTHEAWVRTQFGWSEPAYVSTYLVCDRTTVDRTAADLARVLFVVPRGHIVGIAEEAVAMFRALRVEAPGLSTEELSTRFTVEFATRKLDVDTLALRLNERAISQLRTVG